jgi:hypothetical protein
VVTAALIGFLVGALAGWLLAARSRPVTWPAWVLAAVLALEVAWLVVYARGEDTYFFPQHVTRWDFAGRDGNQWIVVAACAVAAVAAALLVWGAAKRKGHALRLGYAGTAASSVLLFVATFVLTVGH